MARKNDNAGKPRRQSNAAKKAATNDREVPSRVVEDRKDTANQNPTSQEAIQARRLQDAKRKQAEVQAREQQLAEAAAPGEHPDVVVSVKATERAARAEQERIDAGKRTAQRQQAQPPAPPPPTKGAVPEEVNPAHPFTPDPRGSAPHSASMPAGPMDADVIYRTDDINADGTPLIRGKAAGFVEAKPEYDGEGDRLYTDELASGHRWQHSPAAQAGPTVDGSVELEPVINSHSEEGARLDEIKLQRPVQYVPNEFTLDPKSGKGAA